MYQVPDGPPPSERYSLFAHDLEVLEIYLESMSPEERLTVLHEIGSHWTDRVDELAWSVPIEDALRQAKQDNASPQEIGDEFNRALDSSFENLILTMSLLGIHMGVFLFVGLVKGVGLSQSGVLWALLPAILTSWFVGREIARFGLRLRGDKVKLTIQGFAVIFCLLVSSYLMWGIGMGIDQASLRAFVQANPGLKGGPVPGHDDLWLAEGLLVSLVSISLGWIRIKLPRALRSRTNRLQRNGVA